MTSRGLPLTTPQGDHHGHQKLLQAVGKGHGNQRLFPLSETDLAVFELGEDGKLALVGTSQATGGRRQDHL
jgi:hypothetical protein